MARFRILGAISALALLCASAAPAHAQTKTPPQLNAATAIGQNDLLLIWPAGPPGGPLESVAYSVLAQQLSAALGGTYAQLSGATFTGPLSFAGTTAQVGYGVASGLYGDGSNVAVRALNATGSSIYFESYQGTTIWGSISGSQFTSNVPITAPSFAGPLSGNASTATTASGVTNGAVGAAGLASGAAVGNIGFTPVHPSYTGQGTPHVMGLGWNGNHPIVDVDNGNVTGAIALSADLGGFCPLTGCSYSGPLSFGSTSAQIGYNVSSGFYGDANNISLRALNVSGSTIYFQSYQGNSTWATINANGLSLNVPIFGTLNGTASNASQLGGSSPSTSAAANTVALRDSSGNLTASTFYGALSGTASTAQTANAGASGFTIGGQPAAYVQSNGSGAGSISYGTAAPGTLAVGAIYLQTN